MKEQLNVNGVVKNILTNETVKHHEIVIEVSSKDFLHFENLDKIICNIAEANQFNQEAYIHRITKEHGKSKAYVISLFLKSNFTDTINIGMKALVNIKYHHNDKQTA
ncbi:hypothetical protein E9993_06880 [Labilibacter sediminis]|nr:hypothetical protein E9993_06880 [Labilibacter sediminis]